MLGHRFLPSALRGDLLDPATPTGQAEQPRLPLRYVSCAAGVGADRSLGAASGLFLATSPGVEDLGEPENAAAAPGSAPLRHASARPKGRNGRHPRWIERPGDLRCYTIFYVLLPNSQRGAHTGNDPVNSSILGIRDYLDEIHSSPHN
jgi:hypothetical protein